MESMAQDSEPVDARLEDELAMLESEMPRLQASTGNVFAFASAWAERHDAIIAAAPPAAREQVAARLRRIGIRWGMMDGKRLTGQFPALPPEEPGQAAD